MRACQTLEGLEARRKISSLSFVEVVQADACLQRGRSMHACQSRERVSRLNERACIPFDVAEDRVRFAVADRLEPRQLRLDGAADGTSVTRA